MGDSKKWFHLQASKGMEWCPKPPGLRLTRPRPAQVPTLLPADSSPQQCTGEAAGLPSTHALSGTVSLLVSAWYGEQRAEDGLG